MATDLGKVGIRMRGTWDSSTAYEVLDAVSYNNGLYIAKQAVPANTLPTNTTYWQAAILPVTSVKFEITKIHEEQSDFLGYGIYNPSSGTVTVYISSKGTTCSDSNFAQIPSQYLPSSDIQVPGFIDGSTSNLLFITTSGTVSQFAQASFTNVFLIAEYSI